MFFCGTSEAMLEDTFCLAGRVLPFVLLGRRNNAGGWLVAATVTAFRPVCDTGTALWIKGGVLAVFV